MQPQNRRLSSSYIHSINGQIPITSIAISPDSQTLISASNDGNIQLRNIATWKLLRTIDTKSNGYSQSRGVSCLIITPDGSKIISGTGDNSIKLWEFATGKLLHSFKDSDLFTPLKFALAADGQTLICGSAIFSAAGEVETVSLWNLTTRKLIRMLKYSDIGEVNSGAIAISPDSETFIVESAMGENLLLLDTASGKILGIFKISSNYSRSSRIVINPDGQILVRGSEQNFVNTLPSRIEVWHLTTGNLLYTITQENSDYVTALAISPDGNTLFSGGLDNTIKSWNLHTGELLNTFTGHQDRISSIAISPNGQILVSGSQDCTVKIWRI
ncbi:serine/threonine-protein kinase-like domain protein [Richelia sinica FACHB-800]|uniref:Serine/threonine-protein kinase-like domain protein n=1 Tax=Richelia sinica FACHB-800 TaxID=1357546 RepID=A0A975TCF4_9NOST|nr:WD40 repeat domain-containing protein [Richelia sinica]MBD2666928.1 WD40 repeat domain-containing protein [Richelia sinica FACHB-800]QXE26200.1 serine/threonine-protein kinase-like domain protein [Richelia sinica FACHB-800]